MSWKSVGVGAGIGAMFGGPIGALVGAGIGSWFSSSRNDHIHQADSCQVYTCG